MHLSASRSRPSRHLGTALLVLAVAGACSGLLVTRDPSDLDVYRAAGRAVLSGEPLYGVRVHGLGFTYPPVAGLLAVATALVPRLVATVALTVASLAASAVVVRHCAPSWWAGRRAAGLVATSGVTALLCSEPVRSTLRWGQVDLLLAALVLADLGGSGPRPWRGVGVGLAAAIKLTPGIFVVHLLLRRRFREAGCALAAFGAASLVGTVLLPGDSWQYGTRTVYGGGVGDFASVNNNSIHGALARAMPVGPAAVAWAPLALLGAAAGLACAQRLAAREEEVAALGAVGLTGCVVSPVSWDHHWVWCLPWLCGLAAGPVRRPAHARLGLAGAGLVFLGRDLAVSLVPTGAPLLRFVVVNSFVEVAVLAASWSCAATLVERRRSPASPAPGPGVLADA